MKITKKDVRNIVKEEIINVIKEISPYDAHLIPKEVYWSDDEIIEYLKDMKSISKIIESINYRKQAKRLYDDLIYSTKLDIVHFILKYNLNIGNESKEHLEKLSINDLEEYISYKLDKNAKSEYDAIIYEFASSLVNEGIIETKDFYNLK